MDTIWRITQQQAEESSVKERTYVGISKCFQRQHEGGVGPHNYSETEIVPVLRHIITSTKHFERLIVACKNHRQKFCFLQESNVLL